MLGLLPAATPGAALHVVFSAECTPLFDWHSVGLFYSFYASGQHGNITRLLACSEAEQAKYPKANLEIGPTFIHRNMRDDPLVDEKGYPSYNKPYSVMSWLAATKITEDYVLMLDADMVMRQPIEPTSLGARRGNVVSAEYTYLYGTTNGFTERFIPKKLQRRLAQVGGFHIFHKEDLRAISPLWLEYTKKVRAFGHKEPDTFFRESMWLPADTPESTKSVRRKQAMWHSEMYGYVFAAALVGVTHRVRRDVMLYPGYQPFLGAPPAILHYGSDYTTVGNAYFNKMMHTELHLDRCPNFLFPDPVAGNSTPAFFGALSKRDALCVEHLGLLNAAFCEFYQKIGCAAAHMPPACGADNGRHFYEDAVASRVAHEGCEDTAAGCAGWAKSGECTKNALFMNSECKRACGNCGKPLDELLPGEKILGDWKYAARQKGETVDDDDTAAPEAAAAVATEAAATAAAVKRELPPPPPPVRIGDGLIDDTPPPMRSPPSPPPPPSDGSCADTPPPGESNVCGVFVSQGRCQRELSKALAWCRKSCGLCKVAAEQGARLLRGLGAEDDVSGYGHRRSAAERARREQAESGDSALLIVGSLFAVGMLGGCVLRSKACARREKLEAKCAV